MSFLKNLFGGKDTTELDGPCDAFEVDGQGKGMVIKVMGTGCKKCRQLHENALDAVGRIDKAARVEHVSDVMEIAAAGVMTTPALVVDGKVVSTGKVLTVEEIEGMLR